MKISAWPVSRTVLAVLVISLAILPGSAWSFISADYFPVTSGITWTYLENGSDTSTVTVTAGTGSWTGTQVFQSTNGTRNYFTNTNGIRLHGQYIPDVNGSGRNLTLTYTPPIVLANASPNFEDIVSSSGTAHFDFSGCSGTADLQYSATFTVTDPPDVIVPAGTFTDVVQLSGTIHINAGSFQCFSFGGPTPIAEQNLQITFYSARNIGTVQLISGADTGELTASNLLLPNVTPTSWDYGSVGTPGGTSDKIFTIQNTGPGTLNISTALVQAGTDFSGGGPFTLGPNASTTVTVGFAPTSLGAKSATLQVTNSDHPGVEPKEVPLSGTGASHTLAITVGPSGSPDPVASSGTATLGVTANDSLSHSLTYAWAVTGCTGGLGTGSFNNAALQNPTWTSPPNTTGTQQSCTIQVTVNDGVLPAVLGSYSQEVNAVPPHALSIIGGPSGIPNPVASSGTAALSVTANDTFGHGLTYAWTVISCTGGLTNGSFNNAALQNPTWTSPPNTTGSAQSCTIQVTVNDGAGGGDPKSVSQSFTETVNILTHSVTITGGPSGIPNPVASGGTVALSVTAADTFGHGLNYAWTVISCTGGLTNGSFNNAALQNPTWTAPANTTVSAQSCTIQVTVNDGVLPAVLNSYIQTVSPAAQPPPSYALTVTKAGTGTVTSGPAGIDCGGDCTENYTSGTSVTLTAAPTDGATFGGWGGDCLFSGPAVTCTLTMGGARTASATFNAPPPPGSYTLTVTKAGTGTVTSSPAGIDCGGTCSAPLANGIGVTLTAAPTDGATFGGWGGACASFGTATACTLTMDGAKTASATFNAPPPSSYPLTVTKGGSGSGSVAGSPAGIDCGGDCTEDYASGTSVTLTAATIDGSTFDGWGGDCAGSGTALTCTLTMDGARTASATFTAPPTPGSTVTRTFLTTDAIVVEHIYYDPNDACLGVSPFTLKFFVFSMDGQLVLGRNRDTTGGVTNTQIGASKYQTLVATLDPGTLPPGGYNVIFRVEDCTATAVYVSEFYTIEVFAAP